MKLRKRRLGERKTKTRFAWLPVKLSCGTTIWLEFYHEELDWALIYRDPASNKRPLTYLGWYVRRRYQD